MKSSRNLNPPDKVQSWMPTDFIHNLLNLAAPEGNAAGEPRPLFEKNTPTPITDRQSGGLLQAGLSAGLESWTPTEFNIPKPEKTAQAWQPVIRYNAAVSAAEVSTQMINDARRQADEILRQAEIQANSVREQAYQDGWNNSMQETQKNIETTQSLIQEAISWRDSLYTLSEPMVLDLVRSIAQKLFGDGFVVDSEILQATFNRILENARSLGNLRIYVNPEDSALLGPYWRELQESITSHKVEIIPSNSISRGGCYINGQWGSTDGRIESQLKNIIDTLAPEEELQEAEEKS
jgi:flagellar assembly protein FliH